MFSVFSDEYVKVPQTEADTLGTAGPNLLNSLWTAYKKAINQAIHDRIQNQIDKNVNIFQPIHEPR